MQNKEEEIIWTEEALRRVENAPEFVRSGIRKLMVKRAKERGKKVIDSDFLTEIRNESMMLAAKRIKKIGFEELKIDAFDKAKEKLKQYLEDDSHDIGLTKEAKERMEKVPHFVREMAKKTIEEQAKKKGYRMITGEFLTEIFNELIPSAVKESMGVKRPPLS